MPRAMRIEYEGGRYHVLSRGDRREDIFFDDGDRKRFVETLGEAATRAPGEQNATVDASSRYAMNVGHLYREIQSPA
jgi:putative transposase